MGYWRRCRFVRGALQVLRGMSWFRSWVGICHDVTLGCFRLGGLGNL